MFKELSRLQVTSPSKKVTFVTLLADETIHPRYEEALKHVEREFGKHHPMFIDGGQVLAGGEFEVHSPVDSSTLLGYFQKGTAEFARKALEAANEHFAAWCGRSWEEGVQLIGKAAVVLEKGQFHLAALMTYGGAKNRYRAVVGGSGVVDFLNFYASFMEENGGDV